MQRRALLFDLSHITQSDIELAEVDLDKAQAGDFVIFKTNMLKQHRYGTKEYFTKYVQLSK